MQLSRIYECLCERTRLRIVNLLMDGPLCVRHLQEALGEPQVKVTKHLAYLKARGLVSARQEANWRVQAITDTPSPALAEHLDCLRRCAREDEELRRDLARLRELRPQIEVGGPAACRRDGRGRVARKKKVETHADVAVAAIPDTVVNLYSLP
ncbi:metalloregulator ArsR/SmtB family transcription factor [Termitidicoccus mucosus]|uniref:ArsR/SmtB family transcription factor n=1 Tax=Termitidicoccus mucosus TaxID=1184151 RepID=UPI000A00B895